MNFLLTEMTFMKYFIPLIVEGNKRNINSKVFYNASHKYNCPVKNFDSLISLSTQYNFEVDKITNVEGDDIIFMIEGCGVNFVSDKKNKKVSMSYMTDFHNSENNYINNVDYIIHPNKNLVKKLGSLSEKHLYLGVGKYDYLSQDRKYKKNSVVIFYPRLRDHTKMDLSIIYGWLKELGYNIIVKSRGKDLVPNNLRGDEYYLDGEWYPNISLDLLRDCDFIINFSSTTIKECVMLNTPLINFHIKPFPSILGMLHNYDFCHDLNPNCSQTEFNNTVDKIQSSDYTLDFKQARNDWLFEKGNVCKNILDTLL